MIDVSIVSDDVDLNGAYESKCTYYSREAALVDWVAERTHTDRADVHFGAVILNWRGAIAPKTGRLLKEMFVTESNLEVMVVRTLEFGYLCWKQFKDATWHGGRRRHSQ